MMGHFKEFAALWAFIEGNGAKLDNKEVGILH